MITKFVDWARMIKLEHTLFSLPFVISSALLAIDYQNGQIDWMIFFWISLCLLGARSAGMTLNRIFDAEIDSLNPRTQDREIPQGKINKSQAWFFTIVSLVLLIFSTLQLPQLCQILLPIALTWLFAYSWMKRVTWLCHFVLGTTLGGATLGAWIAITGNLDSFAPVYLALAVSFWVAGFDIFYSLQDEVFDLSQKLHSIPARFGKATAVKIARFTHLLTPIFLYLCGEELALGFYFKLAILFTVIALFYEQQLVNEEKIEKAFFTVNSWISVMIMVFVILELYLSV
ncbi:MAG: 4-hydroxybenzoate octaprenyltransferase [Candidatus Melainabacteria bacterium]|jgi:4-hydroxybenzoate polyprenyltransferase|nr:4-hydroxybenzoate octaprenyltransferase [Candidatus Melainabacteria bacterium]